MAPTASSSTTSTSKVLSPKSLAHVVLRTGNYKVMVTFYKAFLGAHAVHENDQIAFLTYDEEHHRIAIVNVPACATTTTTPTTSSEPPRAGMDHMAFSFDSLQDLLLAYRQRKAAHGIVPVWCCNHGFTVSCYYADPDGNRIETQVDVMSAAAADRFIKSPEFAENPIGVDFDPEDLIRRLDGGEAEAEVVKRGNIGPRGLDSVPTGLVVAAGAASV